MKKTISLMLCLFLIFSSVNFAFADFGASDSSNLSNLTTYTNTIKNALTNSNGAIYTTLNYISNRLLYGNKSAANWLSDIYNGFNNYLSQSDGNTNQTIAWWVKEAVLDLDQLVGSGNGTVLNYLDNIYQRLVDIKNSTANTYTETHTIRTNVADLMENYMPAIRNAITIHLPVISTNTGNIDTTTATYLPYLSDLRTALTNEVHFNENSGLSVAWAKHFAHYNLFRSLYGSTDYDMSKGRFTLPALSQTGQKLDYGFYWNFGTPLGNIAMMIQQFLYNEAAEYQYRWSADLTGYNSNQTATNWLTLQNSTFTPTSQTNGLYSWLSNIQTPIARLAYVHASDEEIAAREKAAANQDAVVDNFIDSTGSGAAPASSFGNVASMSSGYTSNMNTDAQASGIWNIFNSNNFGWFSQETANQLDTTTASTRKGYNEFETPLLDQQIEEIYKELGVDVND